MPNLGNNIALFVPELRRRLPINLAARQGNLSRARPPVDFGTLLNEVDGDLRWFKGQTRSHKVTRTKVASPVP